MTELAINIASAWVLVVAACLVAGVVLSVLGFLIRMIMEDPTK